MTGPLVIYVCVIFVMLCFHKRALNEHEERIKKLEALAAKEGE